MSFTTITRGRCTTSHCARRFCRGTRNSKCVLHALSSSRQRRPFNEPSCTQLTHGSFTSILGTLGQQALELQLERFFTVWAWKLDVQGDSEFGNCFGAFVRPHLDPVSPLTSWDLKLTLAGVPLHPLYKSIGTLLDDFVLDHAFLKNCAPFVLAHPYLIPSTDYSEKPPPPSLPLYVRSRLRVTHSPPTPATPSESSPLTSKPGTDIFASSMSATREAMEATGHAFVTIGASMDVRKWNWPGYLTFNRGVSPKLVPQDQPTDTKGGSEEKPEDAPVDPVAGEPDFPGTEEAGLPGEVDRESLHEAMSTDGIEMIQQKPPSEEQNGTAVDSTSQTRETSPDADVAPPTAIDSLQCEDEQELSSSSSPPSPSTPVVHPPSLTSPPSLSSSQSTIPVPAPAPSFRSFSLHFASHDDPLATEPRRVLHITVSEYSDTSLYFTKPSHRKSS